MKQKKCQKMPTHCIILFVNFAVTYFRVVQHCGDIKKIVNLILKKVLPLIKKVLPLIKKVLPFVKKVLPLKKPIPLMMRIWIKMIMNQCMLE